MTRLSVIVLCLIACADTQVVEFRVASADDPLAEATRLVLALEQGGVVLTESEHPVELADLTLTDLPFGEGYRLRLDALAGPFLLARGRSFPFDVRTSGPTRSPDIWFAPIGRFSTPLGGGLDAPPAAVVATTEGALIATDAGTLYRWTQHGPGGAPTIELLAMEPTLAGASFAPRADTLLAAGGDQLRIVYPDGTLGDPVAIPGFESGVVANRDDRVVVAGYSQARIFGIVGNALALERELELPCSVVGSASAAIVPVTIPEDGARLVTICDDGRTLVELDLLNGETTTLELETSIDGAALTSIGPGLLLVTGGRDADGVIATTHVVTVQERLLVELSPAPEPLFNARTGHRAIALRPGLALVVGGVDDSGAIAAAELVAFPGDVVLTDSLRFDGTDVRATLLGDGTVLVVSRAGGSLWVVPR